MNKCFITKLPSSVDNDNLPVLGQLRINWLKQSDLKDNDARAIGLSTNDSITVKVSGAHFADNTLTSNLGNTKTINAADGLTWLYVSNDANAVLTIDNKYSLTNINFLRPAKDALLRSVYFDVDDIRYCTNITNISAANTKISGDISALSRLTNLTGLDVYGSQISGDISALSHLTNLFYLRLAANPQINGDISALSNLTNLTNIEISNTSISGDISAVSTLTNVGGLNMNYTNVSGDISNLANLTKLTQLGNLNGLSLTGDMSKIPANVYFIKQADRKVNTNFTWAANGRQNVTFLGMEGNIPFDTSSMDNMLIDQATCTIKSAHKVLQVRGIRTSASDAAITTLQNMGVTITGVTKA